MRFEWDEDKNDQSAKARHLVRNRRTRLEDSNRLEFVERIEGDEQRWHAIGCVRGSFLFLTVVHTYTEQADGAIVRIISARRATRHEGKLYAEAIL